MCTTCSRPASGEETTQRRIQMALNALQMAQAAIQHAENIHTEEEWQEGKWTFATKLRKVTNFYSELFLVITPPNSCNATLLRQVLGYRGAVSDELVLKLKDIRQ